MAKGKEFKRPTSKKSKRFKVDDLEPSPNYDLYKPIFSFRYMKYQGPCCISTRRKDKKSLIIDTLLRLSQLTWRQIINLPREQGFEKMPIYRFNVPLPSVFTPEVPILVARYDKSGRLAGFRNKDIYHVVLAGRNLYSH